MERMFNHLLLPVSAKDLSKESFIKAIEFANQLQCHLHIICIMDNSYVWWAKGLKVLKITISELLTDINTELSGKMKEGLRLRISIKENEITEAVKSYLNEENIDLVVFSDNVGSDLHTRNISTIAAGLKAIVLNVGAVLPVNKIRAGLQYAKSVQARLLVFSGQQYPSW